MGRNGIEPPTYGFSDRRSTTELPKKKMLMWGGRDSNSHRQVMSLICFHLQYLQNFFFAVYNRQ
jgi:hypothetical protein